MAGNRPREAGVGDGRFAVRFCYTAPHDLDVGSGSLLPTTSVDQYGATLASWFGLSATQIADVFPNIGNFSTRNLGFMG